MGMRLAVRGLYSYSYSIDLILNRTIIFSKNPFDIESLGPRTYQPSKFVYEEIFSIVTR